MRAGAKFCSVACRRARWRRRRRTAQALAQPHRCEVCRQRIVLVQKRRDARYCSPACRQRAYRKRKTAAAAKPTKAHQRVIRERLAVTNTAPAIDIDIGKAIVRPITTAEAAAIIMQYEWLGSMPAAVRHCYGIFFDGELGGAAVYGDEYGENLNVWRRYGFAGKIIALKRGACSHWAHAKTPDISTVLGGGQVRH
jgi:hypothetical protein